MRLAYISAFYCIMTVAAVGQSQTSDTRPSGSSPPNLNYTEIINGVNIEMIWIPEATFLMGAKDPFHERYPANEQPQHVVRLDGFWIGKYELTKGDWESLQMPGGSRFKGSKRLPVDNVGWTDAMDFCRRLSILSKNDYTLPTEAQWEYACRSLSNTEFYWGGANLSPAEEQLAQPFENKWGDIGGLAEKPWVYGQYEWLEENSRARTHEVGLKMPNAFGLYDTGGNVGEWCLDWYDENFYARSPKNNPLNNEPGKQNCRVMRGGSWNAGPVRFTCRSALGPDSIISIPVEEDSSTDNSEANLGFRVVRNQDSSK